MSRSFHAQVESRVEAKRVVVVTHATGGRGDADKRVAEVAWVLRARRNVLKRSDEAGEEKRAGGVGEGRRAG